MKNIRMRNAYERFVRPILFAFDPETAHRLTGLRETKLWPRKCRVGINIGKSRATPLEQATADYLYSFRRLNSLADYVVINVSSPNTPGLRELQSRDQLAHLLGSLRAEAS